MIMKLKLMKDKNAESAADKNGNLLAGDVMH